MDFTTKNPYHINTVDAPICFHKQLTIN